MGGGSDAVALGCLPRRAPPTPSKMGWVVDRNIQPDLHFSWQTPVPRRRRGCRGAGQDPEPHGTDPPHRSPFVAANKLYGIFVRKTSGKRSWTDWTFCRKAAHSTTCFSYECVKKLLRKMRLSTALSKLHFHKRVKTQACEYAPSHKQSRDHTERGCAEQMLERLGRTWASHIPSRCRTSKRHNGHRWPWSTCTNSTGHRSRSAASSCRFRCDGGGAEGTGEAAVSEVGGERERGPWARAAAGGLALAWVTMTGKAHAPHRCASRSP